MDPSAGFDGGFGQGNFQQGFNGGGFGKGGYDMGGRGEGKGKGKKGRGKGKKGRSKGKTDIFLPGGDNGDRVVPKLTEADAKEARTIVVKAQIAQAEKDDLQVKAATASKDDLQAMLQARFQKSRSNPSSAASSPQKASPTKD